MAIIIFSPLRFDCALHQELAINLEKVLPLLND